MGLQKAAVGRFSQGFYAVFGKFNGTGKRVISSSADITQCLGRLIRYKRNILSHARKYRGKYGVRMYYGVCVAPRLIYFQMKILFYGGLAFPFQNITLKIAYYDVGFLQRGIIHAAGRKIYLIRFRITGADVSPRLHRHSGVEHLDSRFYY